MIELKNDRLVFSFPEVHKNAKLTISFQRTLRIPDDGKDYPLPPGLGQFPMKHVDQAQAGPGPRLRIDFQAQARPKPGIYLQRPTRARPNLVKTRPGPARSPRAGPGFSGPRAKARSVQGSNNYEQVYK